MARSDSRAFDVRRRNSDSGVVMRMSDGSRWNLARSAAGVSPVRNAIVDPILHQIGNLLGRTLESEMATGASEFREQLPQCRTLLSDKSHDHLGTAAGCLVGAWVGEILGRQVLVQRQMREVVSAEPQR